MNRYNLEKFLFTDKLKCKITSEKSVSVVSRSSVLLMEMAECIEERTSSNSLTTKESNNKLRNQLQKH